MYQMVTFMCKSPNQCSLNITKGDIINWCQFCFSRAKTEQRKKNEHKQPHTNVSCSITRQTLMQIKTHTHIKDLSFGLIKQIL